MRLEVNGEAFETQEATLEKVLIEYGFGSATIATAINGDFVPAAMRKGHALQDGDRIEVLAPMQGG